MSGFGLKKSNTMKCAMDLCMPVTYLQGDGGPNEREREREREIGGLGQSGVLSTFSPERNH